MIRSFRCGDTARLFQREPVARFSAIAGAALRRLTALHSAKELGDLRVPPGNRLEALQGDRRGQHSIRVNERYRVCFRWRDGGADDVEIVDYH